MLVCCCMCVPASQVLDAPALADDFYLNLVDWSAQNLLAVGLDSCVYLWNAHTSKVRASPVTDPRTGLLLQLWRSAHKSESTASVTCRRQVHNAAWSVASRTGAGVGGSRACRPLQHLTVCPVCIALLHAGDQAV